MTRRRAVDVGCVVLIGLMALVMLQRPSLTGQSTRQQITTILELTDYASVQAAIDALPDGGGIVRLPAREIEIFKPLEVTSSNIRVVGSGFATHLINRNEEGAPAIVLCPLERNVSDQGVNRQLRIGRIQLADLRISGNPRSGDAVLAVGINDIYMHNLFIDHNGGNGIKLADCYENPRITDCNITYNSKAGLKMISSSHNPVINGNHFEENRDGIEAIHIFNICMTGNNFDDQTRHGIIVEDSWGGVLTGNMVEQCRGTGIVMDRDCYGFAITANIIGQNYEGGIDLRDAWGCAVSANTFSITHRNALVIGSGSGRITVTGNNFSNSHIGGQDKRDERASGIHLNGTQDVTITGNVFSGLYEKAIQASDNCRRIIVSSNLTTDLRDSPGLDVDQVNPLIKLLNMSDETHSEK